MAPDPDRLHGSAPEGINRGIIVPDSLVPRFANRVWASRIMAEHIENDEEDLPVPLNRELRAWLARLSRATGDPPRKIVASMLHMIRTDDEALHHELGANQARHIN